MDDGGIKKHSTTKLRTLLYIVICETTYNPYLPVFAYLERLSRTTNSKPHKHDGPQQATFTNRLNVDFRTRIASAVSFLQTDIFIFRLQQFEEKLLLKQSESRSI